MERDNGTSSSGSASENESYYRASLEEYATDEAVRRYVSCSAGSGITYLLQHIYGPLYEEQIDTLLTQIGGKEGFRILEYGCGAGMNLVWIVKRLLDRRVNLEFACGTDFSSKMIDAAKKQASSSLPSTASGKVFFHTVATGCIARKSGRPGAGASSPGSDAASPYQIQNIVEIF